MDAAALPPGPNQLRAFGFASAPFDFLDSCARRYGDWFTLRFPGLTPFVFTSEPQAIRDVFAGDPEELRAGEANAPLGAFMGSHSLILLDGATHLHERRLLLPPFHGERMHAYGELMCDITDRFVDAWEPNRSFPLHSVMRDITFEVILSAVFGFAVGPERARLRVPLLKLFRLIGSPLAALLGVPLFQVEMGGLAPWGKAVRLKREIESVLYREFAARRAHGTAGRTDILSMLLEARDESGAPMSDEALRDEMLTLMLAGHETTAAALAWAFYRLLSNPDVLTRVRDEIAPHRGDPRAVSQLPFLDAVVKETSRLAPVVPNIGRKLRSALQLGSRTLPAGVVVAPCIYLAHRRADFWPEPERFEPDRFLEARVNPTAFFPFGGGIRRCIGAAFATYETKVVLATVLARAELRLARGYRPKVVRSSIAMAPSKGLPVELTTRR